MLYILYQTHTAILPIYHSLALLEFYKRKSDKLIYLFLKNSLN